ncbi:hypothetical protein BH10PLA1_BH10PLA1_03760 [soil metagenome]
MNRRYFIVGIVGMFLLPLSGFGKIIIRREIKPWEQTSTFLAAGDPRAIDFAQQLMVTADHSPVGPDRDQEIRVALDAFGAFQFRPAGKTIVAIMSNKNLPSAVRDEALVALARLHDPATIARLKTEATSTEYGDAARAEAAKSLVEMGDAPSRAILLDDFKEFLNTITGNNGGSRAREVFTRVGDAEFVEQAAVLGKDLNDSGKKSVFNMVLAQLKINAMKTDEQMKIAKGPQKGNSLSRTQAIIAIGEFGPVEMIPELLKLRDNPPREDNGRPADVKFPANKAIFRLQQRYWEILKKTHTPLVPDTRKRGEDQ